MVPKLSGILLSIALICGFAPVSQALDYPNKYVRIIIPFPPEEDRMRKPGRLPSS